MKKPLKFLSALFVLVVATYLLIAGAPAGTPEQSAQARWAQGYSLSASPNPFRFNTIIAYTIPSHSKVTLSVHDQSGQRVAALVDGIMLAPGRYTVKYSPRDRGGIYFVRLQTDRFVATIKIVYTK